MYQNLTVLIPLYLQGVSVYKFVSKIRTINTVDNEGKEGDCLILSSESYENKRP